MSNVCFEDLINNPDPIDPFEASDPNHQAYQCIFNDLQGGVIKNYGRNYSLYIFIQFDKTKVYEIKQWIKNEIAPNITSTWKQLNDTKIFKQEIERRRKLQSDFSTYAGELCTNFFLSYAGYRTFGLDPAHPKNEAAKINDPPFTNGMRQDWENNYRLQHPQSDYWYNPPEYWDIGGDQEKNQSSEVHALILLAHDDLQELADAAKTMINQCETLGKVLACEAGYVLKNDQKMSVGPFGFLDGISQPLFLKKDYENYKSNSSILQWDPKASLNLALVKDPFAGLYSYGSYCVFQKLETNYQLFEEKVCELAKKLGGNAEGDLERASALVIGRFKDGTPIALSDQPNPNSDRHSFNYADDPDGRTCPLHAHIRKTNPRQDDAFQAEERKTKNRIFRAGVTYFENPKPPETLDMSQRCLNKLDYLKEIGTKPLTDNIKNISGLLFVCFQRSISLQFATQQTNWADNRKFPREEQPGTPIYLDPLIGHPETNGVQDYPPDEQQWPIQGDDHTEPISYGFYGCVKVRGGEFFFTPSISFLKDLS